MIENLNYISDDELEQLICQVEENELVTAPPDLMGSILEAAGFTVGPEVVPLQKVTKAPVISAKSYSAKKKEFTAYCFRVITSVAAAVALVFLLPELLGRMEPVGTPPQERYEKSTVVQAAPTYEEVVEQVPRREEVVASKPTPTKEEVLNDTGFFEKVISSTGWFSKESDNN